MTPEERARQLLDPLLLQSGWIVQDRSQTNLAAGLGVAIREALLKGGDADCLLFASGKAIATVEAKPEGYTLTGVEGQSGKYSKGLLDIYSKWVEPLPFAYESTGSESPFRNRLAPDPTIRGVFASHQPKTLTELATQPMHRPNCSGSLWPWWSAIWAIMALPKGENALICYALGDPALLPQVLLPHDCPNASAARRLHLEHLQPPPRTLQAKRVPQSDIASHGVEAFRLHSCTHESQGSDEIRKD